MNQNKGLKRDLQPEQNNTTNWTMMTFFQLYPFLLYPYWLCNIRAILPNYGLDIPNMFSNLPYQICHLLLLNSQLANQIANIKIGDCQWENL